MASADKHQILADLANLCEVFDSLSLRLNSLGGEFGRAAIVRHKMVSDVSEFVPFPDEAEFKRCCGILSECDYLNLKEANALEIKAGNAGDKVRNLLNAVAQFAENAERASRDQQSEFTALRARLKEHAINDPMVRERVWAMTDGLCFYCDIQLVKSGPVELVAGAKNNLFHVDHLVAKADGGPDHLSNYVPACHDCNVSKSSKSFVDFTRKRGVKLKLIEGGAA